MKQLNHFISIIQSNLDQLLELMSISDTFTSNNAKDNNLNLEYLYLEYLIDYLRGEIVFEKVESLRQQNLPEFLLQLIISRYRIQSMTIDLQQLDQLSYYLEENNLDQNLQYWRGEICFVLGLSYLEIKSYEKSKFYFRLAYQELLKIGAHKKAVKSLLNVVVSESRLHNYKKLIIDYEFVAKKSLEFGDPIVAGICFLNISREFQLVGSINLALKYVNKSIDLLREDLGTTHYYTAVLHRSHVLVELTRYNEAQLDYEVVVSCPFPKIQEAAKVLESLIGKNKKIDENLLDPTWVGRWNDLRNGRQFKQLSNMESKLLECLAESDKTKEELIVQLYGEKINYSDAENRFKVLLSRFRKRHPGLITFEENKFKITDELFLKNDETRASKKMRVNSSRG